MGNSEIVNVTGRLEDTLTIERAQNGTTQKYIGENWIVANAIYAGDYATNTGDNLIIGTTTPTPATGAKVLWLDTTGGNLTLNLVTGD